MPHLGVERRSELGIGLPMPQLIVAFVTNCLVAIANAFAVQHLMVEPPWFGTIRRTILYVLITAFLSPAFCALGGTASAARPMC